MPAINALLPIVAASNSQKEGTQARASESRSNALKSAASAVNKGLEQDAAAEKRMQEKRFINVYEEGIQEQGRQQERRSERVAAMELAPRDDTAALAASGSALPPVGEPLPTAGLAESTNPNRAGQAGEPLSSQNPSAPNAETSDPAEQAVVALPSVTETLDVEQQQQAAAAFHASVIARNGAATEKQQALQTTARLGIASAVSSLAQAQQSALAIELALGNTAEQASTQALGDAQATQTAQQESTGGVNRDEQGFVAAQLSLQGTATLATTLAGEQAIGSGDGPEQAQLVRAWRGLETQQLRSAAALTTHTTTQAALQEPVATSVPVSLSGQIQQFAQSLRLASAQPAAPAAERSATSAGQSGGAELSPWRADSTSANAASIAGRGAAPSSPFAQAMQASNFGQPLGEAVGQNAWGESIAQRVSLMAGLKVSSAQIQLDPPELGAMTVKVSVNGDQASVSFHSPHAMVRDALELSFPRLQEMMGQQGMQLIDAQVSDNSSAGQGSGESTGGRAPRSQGDGIEEGGGGATPQIVQVATGLIDFYA